MPLEIRALVYDFLMPVEAKPLHSLEDRTRALVSASSLVGVLDAKEELPIVVPRVEPVEEGCARAANMQVACWRWCKAQAWATLGVGHLVQRKTGPPIQRTRVNGERGIRT